MNAKIKTLLKTFSRVLPDETVIKWKFKSINGHFPDLKNPKTYNEKLLWLNLHNHDPILTKLVDKYAVREYIAEKIGEKYLIPLLGVWDSADDIPFDSLPESFVLKANHDSGSVIVVKDKKELDIEWAKKKLNNALKRNYYHHSREWAYKNVKPRIVCEEFISTASGEIPKDYKIFCCAGVPKMIIVGRSRGKDTTKVDYYDMNFERFPCRRHNPASGLSFEKPINFDEMVECAKILSADFPQVRVDFYEDKDGRVYFGELTFINGAGMHDFKPDEYNLLFGDFIDISGLQNKK